jgi:hypothetical protein
LARMRASEQALATRMRTGLAGAVGRPAARTHASGGRRHASCLARGRRAATRADPSSFFCLPDIRYGRPPKLDSYPRRTTRAQGKMDLEMTGGPRRRSFSGNGFYYL